MSVEVRISDCRCPGSPPTDGDVVYLPERMSAEAGIRITAQLTLLEDAVERTTAWMLAGLRQVSGWNLVDELGRPRPFDIDYLLDDYELAEPVCDKASSLYRAQVMRPLVTRPDATSPRGVTSEPGTARSTSAPTSIRSRQRSSSRAGSGGRQSEARTA